MDDLFDNTLANSEIKNCSEIRTNVDVVEKPSTDKTHSILVNTKQRGNPLLKSINNVLWEYDDIVPDYQIGKSIGVLFLSLRYHSLSPDYIHGRLKSFAKSFNLRILLVLVDLSDPHNALKNLTRICILADLTLMLAWSSDEAGKIVETYKVFENKPPDKIMERSDAQPHQRLVQALTTFKPVNKTDAITLLSTFGSLEKILKASEYQLSQCPGFGLRKAEKLFNCLHKGFCK